MRIHIYICMYKRYFVVIDAQPELAMWSLDLDDNKILLEFSTVSSLNPANNGLQIDCTAILIGPVAGDIMMAVQLPSSAEGLQVDETMATCDLGMEFRSILNANSDLGTDSTNTFLYYDLLNESGSGSGSGSEPCTYSNLLVDSFDVPYSETAGIAATQVVSDNSSPAIASFEFLDLNEGLIVFSFTQPVNVSTFVFADLSLQNSPVNEATSANVSLTGGSCEDGCEIGRYVTFRMAQADLEQLKLSEGICVSISTCYPHHTDMLVEDFGNNLISPYRFSCLNYLLQHLILDTTSPFLVDCELNLSVDSLTLVFNEPVDVITFNPLGIALINNFSLEMETITLTDASSVRGPSSSIVVVDLGSDADKLKISMLNQSIYNVLVSLLPSAFEDIAGNSVQSVLELVCYSFIFDNHAPSVTSFTLDLNSNLLQIKFSEPILVDSLNISAFKLTDSLTATNMIILNNSFAFNSDDTAIKITSITFGSQSLTRIKTSNDIGTTVDNTYLLIDEDSFSDTNGNGYVSPGPIAAAAIIADNSPATAVGFSLDMNIGQVVLTFNDVVDVGTWANSETFIQNAPLAYQISHWRYVSKVGLSGVISSYNSNLISLDLMMNSFNSLKVQLNFGTATELNTTYLTIQAHAINDIRGVDIIAVTDGNGIRANDYVRDSEPPQLLTFQLDLHHDRFWFVFDEPLRFSSFLPSLFILQGDSLVNTFSSSMNLSFSGEPFTCYYFPTTCYYYLPHDVMVALEKNPNIARDASTTNLVIMQGGVTDTSGNSINTTGPIPAAVYYPSRSKFNSIIKCANK